MFPPAGSVCEGGTDPDRRSRFCNIYIQQEITQLLATNGRGQCEFSKI